VVDWTIDWCERTGTALTLDIVNLRSDSMAEVTIS
jgi:hypothetical protein